jgi:hypothetical protein
MILRGFVFVIRSLPTPGHQQICQIEIFPYPARLMPLLFPRFLGTGTIDLVCFLFLSH